MSVRRRRGMDIEVVDLRPKRRNIERRSTRANGWVTPREDESTREVKVHVAPAVEVLEAQVAPAPDIDTQDTAQSIVEHRKKETRQCVEFLEGNFLIPVQRHFNNVLVEAADSAYRRNKLGRPTKCMSQKESVQQTIDKMQEHLIKMKSIDVNCPDFETKMKTGGRVFMELHANAQAGCMTLHATYKKKGASRSRTQRSRRSKRSARRRPASASRAVDKPMDQAPMHPIHHNIKNDAAVSHYVMHSAQQDYEGTMTEFEEPRRRHSLDDMMEITDMMDVDFDTELPSEIIEDLDMGLADMPQLTDMPMDMDEDNEFISENLFEKLASIM